jgi:hypothetical protein
MSSPLRHAFVPRLSGAASEEYVALSFHVADVTLTEEVDALGKTRRAGLALYGVVVSTGVACDFYKFIWKSCAPPTPKVKFSGCLMVQNRIQTKENLLKKTLPR